jgi:CSLREA domain-containing protein
MTMKTRSKSMSHIFTLFALLAALLGNALFVTPAYALGIVVNTATDEDTNNINCSLREAIIAANTDSTYNGCTTGSGADTITFAAGYVITLLGSQLPAVTTPIVINGMGAANTIIQANAMPNVATYRVLEVGAAGDLTLNDLTVRYGRCNGSCATATTSGGGIYNDQGTLTVSNVTFSANSATFGGGGMYNNTSSPTLTNVTFSANSAPGTGTGGGMYNNTSSPTLTDVTFSANSAGSYGGGMYNNTSNPILTRVTFSATNSATNGGGMYNYNSSSLTLTDVTFSSNSATLGGGMYNDSSSPTLTNVTFSANSTTNGGGGMYNFNSSSPTLTNVTFSANSATSGGGMYNNFSSPVLTDVTFSANTASTSGGGMYNFSSSSPTLTNMTFSANSAGYGGGMYNDSSSPTLMNVTFSANSASSAASAGGGMYNNFSSPTLTNTLIANSAGGGDCVNSLSTLDITSSNNLIEDSAGSNHACGLANGVNGNILGQDPSLGPLANNGGFTETHALLAGSLAIDTGTNAGCPTSDQRGASRPQGPTCDIGSVEYIKNLYLPLVMRDSSQP